MAIHLLKLLFLTTLLSFTQSIPLSTPTISNVSHWGSGCPQDTTDFSVTGDSDGITATFTPFSLAIGPSVPQSSNEIFCAIGITFSSVPSVQFAASSTTYHDKLDVADNVTATHLITYDFGGTAQALTRHEYPGPTQCDVTSTDAVTDADRVWSSCGESQMLIITNRGFVTTSGAGSNSDVSSFNTGGTGTDFVWRSC